jgi:hypothetical protein
MIIAINKDSSSESEIGTELEFVVSFSWIKEFKSEFPTDVFGWSFTNSLVIKWELWESSITISLWLTSMVDSSSDIIGKIVTITTVFAVNVESLDH